MSGKVNEKVFFGGFAILTLSLMKNEPRCEKTCLRSFRLGLTKTGLYNYRRWLEASNF